MLKIDCKITAIVYSAKVDELCRSPACMTTGQEPFSLLPFDMETRSWSVIQSHCDSREVGERPYAAIISTFISVFLPPIGSERSESKGTSKKAKTSICKIKAP